MKFTKMHGIGNDYVYVNCFTETVDHPSEVAIRVSDRHFGIGSDGLILIKPSDCADFEMEMYNADGSLGAMCGNGIRCVAKYVYDYGLTDKTRISVATGSGIKYLDLTVEDGKVALVKVDMGAPILAAQDVPVDVGALACTVTPSAEKPIIDQPLAVNGTVYQVTCVSMGNPHCITCVDDVEGLEIEQIGPYFEHHKAFPDRINTEFIRVIDRRTVQMRVWERGSGETWACGTGACAVAVACILNGWTEDQVTVRLRGGDLQIEWDREKNTVLMTGPATVVFDGETK
jgi:diaminopimelate epimerase